MSTNQHIINHLFEFFNFIAQNSSALIIDKDNFKAISHPLSSWPNFIYDVQQEISIKNLAEKINASNLPKHLILNEKQIDLLESELTSNNFIPLAEWACLKLEKPLLKNTRNQELNIKKITNKNELKTWTTVASSGFETIDFTVFENLLNNPKVEFYGGYKNNKLVATAMLFYHNNTAGIYHVVTLPDHKKQGFGSVLFQHCQHAALDYGAERIIAQSTTEGLNAWIKTGMKQYGNFYLFCWNKPNQ